MITGELIRYIEEGKLDGRLKDIYCDPGQLVYQKERYIKTIRLFEEAYGVADVSICSAPGRTEVGGNHTDHQHGEVLAGAINKDAIAVVQKSDDGEVRLISDGAGEICISVSELSKVAAEESTTEALVRGVLAGISAEGYKVGGFRAYITSDVLIGAGLSSSAAFETLIGNIESVLYNDGGIDAVTIAKIGQFAENVYFGKPCGLMDQMACSVGSLVHIDFEDPEKPVIEKVEYDFSGSGYLLCITDTKGSHADLTPDYAAIPREMKSVAAFFGREVLREADRAEVMKNNAAIREKCGDRALLRALHFYAENDRVRKEVSALRAGDMSLFLKEVKASGDSSFKYLQNVYTNSDVAHQSVSVALQTAEEILGDTGVARVHGGGFAGTMQAWVAENKVDAYRAAMEKIFGNGAVSVLRIRRYGGMKVI
ncbi:MAG: galactokinase [Lachnospiraceae bacterium]|nr:galactokinase [Lachnospiraceae bacterium]